MKQKIIYYTDEMNDDFAGTHIKPKIIDGNYKYRHHNIFLHFAAFFVYRIFATPIIWFYLTFIRRVKYVNRKALKRCKSGYFIYGNHTQSVVDAFNPAMLARPHRASIIVSPDAVSVPGLNMFIPILGGIPIPSTLQSTKNYLKYLKYLVSKKRAIFLYPEAHIWPYYNKIRNFPDHSFAYPIRFNTPAYAFVVLYRQRKIKKYKKPKITVIISDPFFPKDYDNDRTKLRNAIHDFMVDTINKYGSYEYIKYQKIDINQKEDNEKEAVDN